MKFHRRIRIPILVLILCLLCSTSVLADLRLTSEFLPASGWSVVVGSGSSISVRQYNNPDDTVYLHAGFYPGTSGSYDFQFKYTYSGLSTTDNATLYTFRWYITREHGWAMVDMPPSIAYLTSTSGISAVYSVPGRAIDSDRYTYEYSLDIDPSDIGGSEWSISILTDSVSGDALDTGLLYSATPVEFVSTWYDPGVVPPYDNPIYSGPSSDISNSVGSLGSVEGDALGSANNGVLAGEDMMDNLTTDLPLYSSAFLAIGNIFGYFAEDIGIFQFLIFASISIGSVSLLLNLFGLLRRGDK